MTTAHSSRDLRDVLVETLIEHSTGGAPISVVVSDSTSTAKIAPFAKAFPDRLINVGIAEQGLVGVAAGLALGGRISVTCNAAPFLVSRATEQIKNDICYSNTNVKLIGLNAGVCYGPLGSTHHAIDDISVMRGFGTIRIFAPADPLEARAMIDHALTTTGPVYIRLDNATFPMLHDSSYRFTPGAIDVLREEGDITLVAMGSVVHEAVRAADQLAAQGVRARVLNVSSIRPCDRDTLARWLERSPCAVTVEEHSVAGGLGSLVCETVCERGINVRIRRLGIAEGTWAPAGPRQQIRHHCGIDAEAIATAARELLGATNRS